MLGDERPRRADSHGLAVRHDRHLVAEALGLLDVVRAHQDRDALAAQPVDERPQLLADLGVEAHRRLVEQHQPRLVQQRPADQQPPAHAAAELGDLRLAPRAEVGEGERSLDRLLALAAGHAVEVAEDEQVLLDGQRLVEVVELRHDAHLRARLLGVLGQLVAEDLELALVGDGLRGEHLHRRRLARAVGSEQPDARALGDLEVEPVDGGELAEALHDAVHAYGQGHLIHGTSTETLDTASNHRCDRAMYDYVIVGAGSAGCVLAARLTEDPEVKVLLLESGPPDTNENIHVPVGYLSLGRTEVDWDLETAPEPNCDNRRIKLPRGRVLGGSSSINAMVYIRGNRRGAAPTPEGVSTRGTLADKDGWGIDGWSYADLLPYFMKAEDNERGASEFHGAGGPLPVSNGRSLNPMVGAFCDAAVEAG